VIDKNHFEMVLLTISAGLVKKVVLETGLDENEAMSGREDFFYTGIYQRQKKCSSIYATTSHLRREEGQARSAIRENAKQGNRPPAWLIDVFSCKNKSIILDFS